jgi:two-component system sensor histidine kinase TorS
VQATQRIRSSRDARLRKLPIIAMSAHVFREEIDEYLEAGMDFYIAKPFQPLQLLQTLHRAVHGEAPELALLEQREENLVVDTEQLSQDLESLGAGPLREIIELFLSSSRESFSEFSAALGAREYARAGSAVHRLKSSAGSIGLEALWSEAARIEKSCRNQEAMPDQPASLGRLVSESRGALLRHWERIECSRLDQPPSTRTANR